MKKLIILFAVLFLPFSLKSQFTWADSTYSGIGFVDAGFSYSFLEVDAFPVQLKSVNPKMEKVTFYDGHLMGLIHIGVVILRNPRTKTDLGVIYYFDGSAQRFTTKGGLFLKNEIIQISLFYGQQDMQVRGNAEGAKNRLRSNIWSGEVRFKGRMSDVRFSWDYVPNFKEFWNNGYFLAKVTPKLGAGFGFHEIYGNGPQLKFYSRKFDLELGYFVPNLSQKYRFNVFNFGINKVYFGKIIFHAGK